MNDMLIQGGPVLWFILFIGLVALSVFLERALHLHRARIDAKDFLHGIFNTIRRGNVTEAIYTIGASAAAAGMANGFARLMTNPRAVMWLAHNTDKPVGEMLGQLQTLRRIGQDTKDPELVELADELEEQSSQ